MIGYASGEGPQLDYQADYFFLHVPEDRRFGISRLPDCSTLPAPPFNGAYLAGQQNSGNYLTNIGEDAVAVPAVGDPEGITVGMCCMTLCYWRAGETPRARWRAVPYSINPVFAGRPTQRAESYLAVVDRDASPSIRGALNTESIAPAGVDVRAIAQTIDAADVFVPSFKGTRLALGHRYKLVPEWDTFCNATADVGVGSGEWLVATAASDGQSAEGIRFRDIPTGTYRVCYSAFVGYLLVGSPLLVRNLRRGPLFNVRLQRVMNTRTSFANIIARAVAQRYGIITSRVVVLTVERVVGAMATDITFLILEEELTFPLARTISNDLPALHVVLETHSWAPDVRPPEVPPDGGDFKDGVDASLTVTVVATVCFVMLLVCLAVVCIMFRCMRQVKRRQQTKEHMLRAQLVAQGAAVPGLMLPPDAAVDITDGLEVHDMIARVRGLAGQHHPAQRMGAIVKALPVLTRDGMRPQGPVELDHMPEHVREQVMGLGRGAL